MEGYALNVPDGARWNTTNGHKGGPYRGAIQRGHTGGHAGGPYMGAIVHLVVPSGRYEHDLTW
jgi:hypothetical protein